MTMTTDQLIAASHDLFRSMTVEQRGEWIENMARAGWEPQPHPGSTPEMVDAARTFMHQVRDALASERTPTLVEGETTKLPAPAEPAVLAYETAVAALRLVDALNDRPEGYVEDDAHGAASTALRAALAAFLVITCPGAERDYYAAAATELYADMFTEGRGVADALGVFLDLGFQHTHPYRTGHDPYTEGGAHGAVVRGYCSCGFHGPDRRSIVDAEQDAIEHAEWTVAQPVMMVPTGG
jgi:hypothetical protein